MGNGPPGMPGPAFFLLLVLPPVISGSGSFLHQLPSWRDSQRGRNYQRRTANLATACGKPFDVYFVLEASAATKQDWEAVCKFVDIVIQKYRNYCCRDHRFSFITYSSGAQTHLTLTSDRNQIKDGLQKLWNVGHAGKRDMHVGLQKANEQIQNAKMKDSRTKSLIITLTYGPLEPVVFQQTEKEANKALNMGTKILAVGVKDYARDQLEKISKQRTFMFLAKAFDEMATYNTSVVKHTCATILNLDTAYVCVGEEYNAGYYLSNLHTINKNRILCMYTFSNRKPHREKPLQVTFERIICKGPVLYTVGEYVIIDLSVNNGATTLNLLLTYTAKDCDPIEEPTKPTTKVTTPTTTKVTTRKTRKVTPRTTRKVTTRTTKRLTTSTTKKITTRTTKKRTTRTTKKITTPTTKKSTTRTTIKLTTPTTKKLTTPTTKKITTPTTKKSTTRTTKKITTPTTKKITTPTTKKVTTRTTKKITTRTTKKITTPTTKKSTTRTTKKLTTPTTKKLTTHKTKKVTTPTTTKVTTPTTTKVTTRTTTKMTIRTTTTVTTPTTTKVTTPTTTKVTTPTTTKVTTLTTTKVTTPTTTKVTTVTFKVTKKTTVVTTKKNTVPIVITEKIPPMAPLFYPVIGLSVIILLLLICVCCWARNKKRDPEEPCHLVLPPCCCQENSIARIEGKLNSLCDFVECCSRCNR